MIATGRAIRALRAAAAGIAVAAVAAVASACEREASPTGPGGPNGELALNEIGTTAPLNASSPDTLVHFSFATGGLVPRTAAWDIALRRFEVRLNGGISGTGDVTGHSLANNAGATNDQVLAFTAGNTLAAFDAIRAAKIPAAAAFESDRLVESTTGYIDFSAGPTANPLAAWKVRTASGGHALVRVTSFTLDQSFALASITFESRSQSGTTLWPAQQVTVPVSGGSAAVSFVTSQAVTPAGCNWDFQVDAQSLALTVNAGCGVGTYPAPASPPYSATTAANDAPVYEPFLAGLTGPIPSSVSVADAPFRYNLEGSNRLHPTFNTYLVQRGDHVYKLQVINYYSASGASGWPTLRYARIR